MLIVWGRVSGEKDIGVVAEKCPRCGSVVPCRVSGVVEGIHVFFIPLAQGVRRAACICGFCGGHFPCEPWRYREMVPASVALSLKMEGLLERTNPALKEKLEWSTRRDKFAADPRFVGALRSLDELPPGALSTRLRGDLRRWGEVDEGQRETLARSVDEAARAMQFARSIAPRIPSTAGCLPALLACVAVWAASFWTSHFGIKALWWGVGVAFAGLMAGAAVYQLVQDRRVRRWTHEILVPEGRKSGIDFRHLVAILDDLPPGPRTDDALRPLQDQALTIREELAVFAVKGSAEFTVSTDPDAF